MSHLSDIEDQMKKMKGALGEIEEKIVSEKEKSIPNFLQALVQCGEISERKKDSIESNVCLAGFFMKDLDDSSDEEEDEDDSSDDSSDEDEEEFEGRYTFPSGKDQETNEFIIRYIKEKWGCNVRNHGPAPYCHENEGDKEIYKVDQSGRNPKPTVDRVVDGLAVEQERGRSRRCNKIILSGLKMRKKTTYRFSSSGETECYWDHEGFGCISYPGDDGETCNVVLRGEKFKEIEVIWQYCFE